MKVIPGGPVIRNPPASAGDTGSIPGPGTTCCLATKPGNYWAHAPWSLCSWRREATQWGAWALQQRVATAHDNWGMSTAMKVQRSQKQKVSFEQYWKEIHFTPTLTLGPVPTGEACICWFISSSCKTEPYAFRVSLLTGSLTGPLWGHALSY